MRRLIKIIASGMATAIVLPLAMLYGLQALLVGRQRAFPGWSQALSLIPGLTGIYLRRAFYRLTLDECQTGSCLCFGTVFSHPTARVGADVYVGLYCSIGDVTLEDDVLIASHVSIMNGYRQHGIQRLDIPVREQPGEWPRITIGRDTWIGERAVVMADVGQHCVIGAGAVVTKPVPDFAIVVGVPAQVVGWRDETLASRPNDNLEGSLARRLAAGVN